MELPAVSRKRHVRSTASLVHRPARQLAVSTYSFASVMYRAFSRQFLLVINDNCAGRNFRHLSFRLAASESLCPKDSTPTSHGQRCQHPVSGRHLPTSIIIPVNNKNASVSSSCSPSSVLIPLDSCAPPAPAPVEKVARLLAISCAPGPAAMDGAGGSKPTRQRRRRPDDENTRISRKLSKVLRHSALSIGLTVRPDGYVSLRSLLASPGFQRVTEEQVRQVVAACSKQRFGLTTSEEGEVLIRANQGHTLDGIQDEQLLQPLTAEMCPDTVVHGTYLEPWPVIRQQGLQKMKRNHVHMAKGLPSDGGVISGMRKSCQVAIYVDAKAAIADGLRFFESENGVILCQEVPPKYFISAVKVNTGEDLLKAAAQL